MTDLVITADDVEQSTGAVIRHALAAVALTAGQAVYEVGDGTVGLADADHATAAVHKAKGIALHSAAAGQPIAYQTAGLVRIGADVAVGEIYVLSGNAGGVAPEADLAVGDEVVLIGVGHTAQVGSPATGGHILLGINPTGVTVAAP
jgi:hypothetical protein